MTLSDQLMRAIQCPLDYQQLYNDEVEKTQSLLRQLKEQRVRLRDEFAMSALTGIIHSTDIQLIECGAAAAVAYDFADAMLVVREEP